MSFILRPLALVVAAALSLSASAQQPYRVIDHWKIGGVGGWDYLLADPAAHLLYVTHGSRVEVMDTTTGKSAGAITGLKGTHGIALAPDGKFGYISDGGANAVVQFDRKTFAVVASIPAGTNPDGIAFEPVSGTVWAFNGRSKDVSVIDPASRAVVATIALPGKPEFAQVDGKGHVFVNIEDKNSIVMLDANTKALTATWPLGNCDSPSGLALDLEHGRLFSVCDGRRMVVTSTATGKQLGTAEIGDGPDAAGYNPGQQIAFASSRDGLLAVVDAAHGYKTLQLLPTIKGGRTMAYDPIADRVYVVSAETGPTPKATAAVPHPRPSVVPDTFQVVVIGR